MNGWCIGKERKNESSMNWIRMYKVSSLFNKHPNCTFTALPEIANNCPALVYP